MIYFGLFLKNSCGKGTLSTLTHSKIIAGLQKRISYFRNQVDIFLENKLVDKYVFTLVCTRTDNYNESKFNLVLFTQICLHACALQRNQAVLVGLQLHEKLPKNDIIPFNTAVA